MQRPCVTQLLHHCSLTSTPRFLPGCLSVFIAVSLETRCESLVCSCLSLWVQLSVCPGVWSLAFPVGPERTCKNVIVFIQHPVEKLSSDAVSVRVWSRPTFGVCAWGGLPLPPRPMSLVWVLDPDSLCVVAGLLGYSLSSVVKFHFQKLMAVYGSGPRAGTQNYELGSGLCLYFPLPDRWA